MAILDHSEPLAIIMSCLVLQNNQQTSWSITLMVVVGHGMRAGAHLAGGGPPSQRSAIAKVRHRKGFR